MEIILVGVLSACNLISGGFLNFFVLVCLPTCSRKYTTPREEARIVGFLRSFILLYILQGGLLWIWEIFFINSFHVTTFVMGDPERAVVKRKMSGDQWWRGREVYISSSFQSNFESCEIVILSYSDNRKKQWLLKRKQSPPGKQTFPLTYQSNPIG